MVSTGAHTFPGSHVLQLVELLARWGVAAGELLDGTGLTVAQLEVPRSRVSAQTMAELSERARALTGEPGLGFYLGLQKRLSMYGYMGFAQMHASTVREGLELAVRYTPTITTGLSLSLEVADDTAVLTIEEHADLGSAHDIALFSFLVGMRQLTANMTGRTSSRVVIEIPGPKPEYFDRFAHLLPGARFDQPALRIRFPARGLDVPLATPDRAALELAREVCERELNALGFDRTFKARTSRLLSDADALAERLGYSTQQNFSRAFRRWTGTTPAEFRKRNNGSKRKR